MRAPTTDRRHSVARAAVFTVAVVCALGVATSMIARAARSAGTAASAPERSDASLSEFDELPRFPKSDPTGPARATATTIMREFEAVGVTPAVVLEFYLDALVDWRTVRQHSSETSWSGRWIDDAYQLTIDARPAPPTGGDERTTYRVVLRDR